MLTPPWQPSKDAKLQLWSARRGRWSATSPIGAPYGNLTRLQKINKNELSYRTTPNGIQFGIQLEK